jgi:hypothetical protein
MVMLAPEQFVEHSFRILTLDWKISKWCDDVSRAEKLNTVHVFFHASR